jgi:hypothetical protein
MSSEVIEALGQFLEQQTVKKKIEPIAVTTDKNTKMITLPVGMSKKVAWQDLKRQDEEEKEQTTVIQKFDGWNYLDFLYMFKKTCEDTFGALVAVKSAWGDPPTSVNIITDIIDGVPVTTEGYYGTIKCSLWPIDEKKDSFMEVDILRDGSGLITVNTIVKYKKDARDFLDSVEMGLRQGSIYKNKAIEVTKEAGKLKFEIFELTTSDHIILNTEERLTIDRDIVYDLTLNEKNSYCFLGDYGNGKSETAAIIAREAMNLGYTYFFVKDTETLTETINQSAKYGDTLIFIEDIDEITSGDRDKNINDILNTIDSIKGKHRKIKILYTTNEPQKIAPAMRRPGRMGILVTFRNPTFMIAKQIIEKHCPIPQSNIGPPIETIDWAVIEENWPDCNGSFVNMSIAKRFRNWIAQGYPRDTQTLLEVIATAKPHIAFSKGEQQKEKSVEVALQLIKNTMFDN